MKNFFSYLLGVVSKHWKGILSAVVISVIAVVIVAAGINIVDGQNQFESVTISTIENYKGPWYRAINAPYLAPAYILSEIINDTLLAARVVSSFICLISAICLFVLVKLWFNVRIASVSVILFITGSWFLSISHQASPLCLLITGPLLLLTPLSWFFRSKKYQSLSFGLFSAGLALSFYIPYMLWIVAIVMSVLLIKERKKLLLINRRNIYIAAGIFFIILIPFFISYLHFPGQIKELIGLPLIWPSFGQYINNVIGLISFIFVGSNALPEFFLGSLPMLDVFSSAMLLLGLYYFSNRLPNRRSLIILSSLAIGLIVIPLSTLFQLNATLLIPFIYIAISVGFVELINQWVGYFPRNPLAKNIGIFLIVVSISFISFYHMQRFFVAWPNTPQVKNVYMVKSK